MLPSLRPDKNGSTGSQGMETAEREGITMLYRSLIISASALAVVSAANAAEVFRMGGGPSGGGWHPAWSAATQLLNEKLGSKYRFQYTPTAGSVENARRVRSGGLASGWAHMPQVYQAWTGTGGFKQDGPSQDFRVIGNVQGYSQIIAVLADSPIHSFSDMKGKVVNLLNKGSGGSANCINIFKSLGLFDKIKPRWMNFSASARALGDRQIDVYCSAASPYTIPALTQLSMSQPVRYISLTPAEQKKVTTAFKFYSPVTIPVQKEVKGMEKPALSIGYNVWWIVSKSMSEQAVTDMLSTIDDPKNMKILSNTARYWKDLSGDFAALVPYKIYVDPAAAKYWDAHGYKVPSEIVKAYGHGS
jgi:TRAP transporter TAXI family solute receptor